MDNTRNLLGQISSKLGGGPKTNLHVVTELKQVCWPVLADPCCAAVVLVTSCDADTHTSFVSPRLTSCDTAHARRLHPSPSHQHGQGPHPAQSRTHLPGRKRRSSW